MSEAILKDKKQDTVATTEKRVKCDGPERSPHPRVYLTMVDDENGKPAYVVCPYCSKTFVYTGV